MSSSSGSGARRRSGPAAGRVLVGRDTRGSGPALEAALARGIVAAGGIAVLGGRAPDARGRAALAGSRPRRLGLAQPARVQRRQDLRPRGSQAVGRGRARDRGAPRDAPGRGTARSRRPTTPSAGYVDHVLEHFGSDLSGLRIAVDCANGAFSAIAPDVFERLGRAGDGARERAGRHEHQRRLRRDRPRPAAGGRARRRLRPRRRLRRRRRPDAGGRRAAARRSTATRSSRSARSRSTSRSSPSRR